MNGRLVLPLVALGAFVLAGFALIIFGMSEGNLLMVVGGGMCVVAGGGIVTFFVLKGAIASASARGPMLHGSGVGSDRNAYAEAQATTETFEAIVLTQRSLGTEVGVGSFGTEMRLSVLRDGENTPGLVRGYLTAAQLAQTTPGASIRVKAAPAYPEMYVLV